LNDLLIQSVLLPCLQETLVQSEIDYQVARFHDLYHQHLKMIYHFSSNFYPISFSHPSSYPFSIISPNYLSSFLHFSLALFCYLMPLAVLALVILASYCYSLVSFLGLAVFRSVFI
jgi:hypothetical protein